MRSGKANHPAAYHCYVERHTNRHHTNHRDAKTCQLNPRARETPMAARVTAQ
jgi:hypothetical protein